MIPDVHGREFWKNAVSLHKNEVDKIVFLGDYLDPYSWEFITRKDAIRNFEEIIAFKQENSDKVVLLLGNHDMPYYSKDFHTRSRYDSSNAWHISEDFKSHRSFFKLAYKAKIGDKVYLFSHAGIMNSWVERNKNVLADASLTSINHLLDSKAGIKALCNVSDYRTWFGDPTGSIVWSDVRERQDNPQDATVEGYDYQIFGHSQQDENPIITDKWACLDCRKAFILNEDGTLETVENETEENKS